MIELLLLIVGLAGLWFGSELIIRGALNISSKYKISHMFVGLTILALCTNLPELFITITGAMQKLAGAENSGLIVGDIIGSSLGQIVLMVGIISLFTALRITKKQLYRDGAFLLGSIALIFIFSLDSNLSKLEGIILILLYVIYFILISKHENISTKFAKAHGSKFIISIFYLLIGLAIIIFSSNLTLENAELLSQKWGVAQSFIGLLLIGLGTSLPELAVSLSALKNKATNMAVGNLIGSSILDLLFVLGLGTAISGFKVSREILLFDIPVLFFLSLFVIIFFRTKLKIDKKDAMILIGLYLVYVVIKVKGVL